MSTREEQQYKKCACAIVEARYTFRRFERTSELVHWKSKDEIRHDKLHRFSNVVTKTFQAMILIKWNHSCHVISKILLEDSWM